MALKRAIMEIMVTFDEEKQDKKVAALRAEEEEQLAQVLSGKYGINYVDLSGVAVNTEALRLIPEKQARVAEMTAYQLQNKKLFLAVRSPNKQEVSDVVKELEEKGYTCELAMTSTASLERAWSLYKDLSFAVETKAGVIDISGEEIRGHLEKLKSLDDIKTHIKEVLGMKKSYRISRIVEIILAGALAAQSSDVHIEPEEDYVRLRYRLDGVLTDITNLDSETYKLILSRIKLLSGLLLNVKNAAQDGRFSIGIEGDDAEVRVSVIPDAYGESIVMRLLNPKSIRHSLNDLGIEPRLLEILKHEIAKPNGLILTTGPTGSGKTTTLYAFLTQISKPEIKIITIEDPVEYHLPGIVQTQIDKDNYTFASGLRAALRQDPDIIMVGEIRDAEVAETAIHSALTGHLVFSTLHTNTAAGAIPRLLGLKVNPQVIGSAVNVAMAQRLVRQLCDECKKQVPLSGNDLIIVKNILDGIVHRESVPQDISTVWEAQGCEKCNNTGYRGRLGVYEAIVFDAAIENLIPTNPSERDIAEAARPQGILSMREDGIVKALRGITSIAELSRVIALDDTVDQELLDKKVAPEKEEVIEKKTASEMPNQVL